HGPEERAAIPVEDGQRQACLRIPYTCSAIRARRQDELLLRAEGRAVHVVRMPAEGHQLLGGSRVPDDSGVVGADGDDQLAVGAEGGAVERRAWRPYVARPEPPRGSFPIPA